MSTQHNTHELLRLVQYTFSFKTLVGEREERLASYTYTVSVVG